MKFEDVMKLLDAGYTKDEILAMNENAGASSEQGQNSDDGTNQNPDPEQGHENNETSVDVSPITNALNEVKETFENMKKEMIAMNIMNSSIDNPEQSADDILANIINPFENK